MTSVADLVKEDKVWFYSNKNLTHNQMFIYKDERDSAFKCESTTGPIYVITSDEMKLHLMFTLTQNARYGTHLFYALEQNKDKLLDLSKGETSVLESQELQAFICGKPKNPSYAKPFTINEVLPKPLESDLWIKGLVLG